MAINSTDGFDPLLECLVIITQLKETPFSAQSLKAGLPLHEHSLTPKLFIRAAKNAGLKSRLIKRPLKKISPYVLPCVLLLKNNQACVLKSFNEKEASIVYPQQADTEQRVALNDLQNDYDGHAFLIKKGDEKLSLDESESTGAWFWKTFWNYKQYYGEVIFVSLFVNLFALALPLFIMNVYDRVIPNYALETLWVLASGIAIIIIFDFIMKSFRVHYVDLAGEKIDVLVSAKLFKHMQGLNLADREASTGVLAHKISQFESLSSFITSSTVISLIDLPFVLLYLLIIYIIGGPIVLIPFMAIPIILVTSYFVSFPLAQASRESYRHGAEKQSVLIETLKNIDLIKSATAEGIMQKHWEYNSAKAARAGVKSRYYLSQAVNFVTAIHFSAMVFVVISGVYLIQENLLSMGGLIACTILTGRALAPLGQLLSLLLRYQLAKISLESLNRIMNLPVERPHQKSFLRRKEFEPIVEFQDATFQYKEQNKPLCNNFSFKINQGEKVAIIGPMGAGKSTMLKLMMGFYSLDAGAIQLSNTDLRQLDPADYRPNIGYVQQEFRLLHGTVRENIALKAPWASDEEIIKACELSGVYKFISNHPEGFDMTVTEDGQDLSGGQRQGIMLARALLMSPSMLLLDEPTSAMDATSEQCFIQRMQNYLLDKTLVLVTHRISLLPIVNRLIVLKDGHIVADGPKDEVMKLLSEADARSL